jgi:hypothetical protein
MFVPAHEMDDYHWYAFLCHTCHFFQRFELVCKVRKSGEAYNGVAEPGGCVALGHSKILKNREKRSKNTSISVLIDLF